MADSELLAAETPDAELVELTRQGDRAAFNQLVDRHARKIFRLTKHITKNDEDAEDALQETFLKAFSRLEQFHGDSKFYTWLVRIAVNESLMRLRKRRNQKTVSLDDELETAESSVKREVADEGDDPEQSYSREETRRLLAAAIDSLAEGYREVFLLRDVEGFSTEETADMLGLSISAVKSRLLRARLKLREKLHRRLDRNGRKNESNV